MRDLDYLVGAVREPPLHLSERPSAPMRDLDISCYMDKVITAVVGTAVLPRGVAGVRYTAYNVLEVIG